MMATIQLSRAKEDLRTRAPPETLGELPAAHAAYKQRELDAAIVADYCEERIAQATEEANTAYDKVKDEPIPFSNEAKEYLSQSIQAQQKKKAYTTLRATTTAFLEENTATFKEGIQQYTAHLGRRIAAVANRGLYALLGAATAGTFFLYTTETTNTQTPAALPPLATPQLEQHLAGTAVNMGEYLIAIDPSKQEEGVYQTGLEHLASVDGKDIFRVGTTEHNRVLVSTGINPGAKTRRGDHKTPENQKGEYFVVTMIEKAGHWLHDGVLAYGPWFARIDTPDKRLAPMGTTPKGSSIGLHGTNEPEKLGTRASQGCIRHDNDTIDAHVEEGVITVGTKVIIKDTILGEDDG